MSDRAGLQRTYNEAADEADRAMNVLSRGSTQTASGAGEPGG